jgi:DNA-binding beta-propeller fold protein YncE
VASVLFPPTSVLSERASITLRGTAADATGVKAVRVNGVAATSTNDFADWEVTLSPTLAGVSEDVLLTVETEDLFGNVEVDAARVSVEFRRHVFGDVSGVTFDPYLNLAVVMDALPARLVLADVDTGLLSPLVSLSPVVQPVIPHAGRVAYHPGLDEVLVAEKTQDDLFGISVGTALQRLISASVGPNDRLMGVVVDPLGDRVFVLHDRPIQPKLMEVDMLTGVRTIFSGAANSGPLMKGGGGLAMDYGANRVLVALSATPSLVGVDLVSGDRTLVSGAGQGLGPLFVSPTAVAVDVGRALAYVVDTGGRAVYSVDLVSGDRTIHSDDANGAGTAFVEPVAITLDLQDRPLVADAGLDALVLVDPQSGDRTAVPDTGLGDGLRLREPNGVAKLRAPGGSYLITDNALDAVVIIDPLTRDRSILSDATTGAGVPLLDPVGIEIESVTQPQLVERAFVIDSGLRALLSVDPVSGDRTVVSDDTIGTGAPFAGLVSFALDASAQTAGAASLAFVLDAPPQTSPSILRVDLATGDRSELSGPTKGNGRFLAGAVSVSYDAYSNPPRLLVLDPFLDSLLAVDLTSGDRTVVSPPSFLGSGPAFGLGAADVCRDPNHARAIVADTAGGRILIVDLSTGKRLLLTDPAKGTEWHGEPTALLIDAGLDRAVAVDQRAAALFSVDLRNGNRVVLSK